VGMMKRALEELSERIGDDGTITDRVIAHAERHPDQFRAAGRAMRRRLGLPEIAEAAKPLPDNRVTNLGAGRPLLLSAGRVAMSGWLSYKMTTPCDSCPFRKSGGVRLAPGRAREIIGAVLSNPGGTFGCHKTVDYGDGYDDEGDGGKAHCAGALIFAEKQRKATQMTRWAERLGLYDAAKLMAGPAVAEVFDTIPEMLTAQWPPDRRSPERDDGERSHILGDDDESV
jgi:hypothetical protein